MPQKEAEVERLADAGEGQGPLELPPWFVPPPGEDESPFEDGVPMETPRHRNQSWLLQEALDERLKDWPDVFIGGDMFLYFSAEQKLRNDFRGPDFFVVLDTQRRERKSWIVWHEGGRVPSLIVELLSDSTAAIDRGEKKVVYGRVLRVPEYYLFDPFTAELSGYALGLHGRDYEPVASNAAGRLPSRQLDLELGLWHGRYHDIEADWLRWFTPDGKLLATALELAESARAEAESARAEAESARAERDRLEARLAAYEGPSGIAPEPGR